MQAQTIYAYDGAATLVAEMTGPPAGLCAFPDGRQISNLFTTGAFSCATVGVAVQPRGGVAVNKVTDTVWVTDGFTITEYQLHAPVRSFSVPSGFVLTGMGWDSAGGILWVTDGLFAAGILPPPRPGCGMPLTVAVPPFPLSPLPSPPATGITWDASTGSLFVCDAGGSVSSFLPGGAPGPSPTMSVVGAGCTLAPPITGITIDSAASSAVGIPVYYVSDATGNAGAFLAQGGLAPPSFYTPSPCFPLSVITPVSVGLAFAAHGIQYGLGADSAGLTAPEIFSRGQSTSPSTTFEIWVADSVASPATVVLVLGTTGGALCPTSTIAGLPIYLAAPPLLTLATGGITPGGASSFPVPIPSRVPAGLEVDAQALAVTPSSVQVTGGLHFTIALP